MSSLNTGSINTSYPNPGVNNSSQGFRDNFAAIKTNLDTTKTELEDLQGKVLVKTALTGTTMNNDMAGSQISNVLTKGFRNTVYDLGANLSNKIDIDLTKGDVQTGTVTGDVTLSFSKWSPSGTRSSVELILTVVPGQTITLPTNVIYGTESIVGVITDASGTSSIKIGNINRIHFVFSSIDCGDSIEIITTDRPKITNNVRFGAPLSAEGDIGDLKGDITFTETYMFLCVKDYTDGVDPIWSRSPLNGTTSW